MSTYYTIFREFCVKGLRKFGHIINRPILRTVCHYSSFQRHSRAVCWVGFFSSRPHRPYITRDDFSSHALNCVPTMSSVNPHFSGIFGGISLTPHGTHIIIAERARVPTTGPGAKKLYEGLLMLSHPMCPKCHTFNLFLVKGHTCRCTDMLMGRLSPTGGTSRPRVSKVKTPKIDTDLIAMIQTLPAGYTKKAS